MERQFSTIEFCSPVIPGAKALGLMFDAPGRLNASDGLHPPVLIAATLRALRGSGRNALQRWALEIEGSNQAYADLKEIAPRIGLAHCYDDRGDGYWRRGAERLSDQAAFALFWPYVSKAVCDDLSTTPADALETLETEYAAERDRVEAERTRRRALLMEDMRTEPTWRVIQAQFWIDYLDLERVFEAREFEADVPVDAAEILLDAALGIDRREPSPEGEAKSRLLHACARRAGLLLGVPAGGTRLEEIDPRLIGHDFRLGNDEARAGPLVWTGVRVDRAKLLEAFPPPAATSPAAETSPAAKGGAPRDPRNLAIAAIEALGGIGANPAPRDITAWIKTNRKNERPPSADTIRRAKLELRDADR